MQRLEGWNRDAKFKQGLEKAAAGLQHDPNDAVAQVLNYSNFGNDDGSPYGAFWYRVDECRYKLSFQGQATSREIDLNTLDPKNIAFEPVGERAQGYSIIEPGVNILYKGHVLMHGDSRDLVRLQRGWGLIYSEYCEGKEEPVLNVVKG